MSISRGFIWMTVVLAATAMLFAGAGCSKKGAKPETDVTKGASTTQNAQSGSQILTAAKSQRGALESGKGNGKTVATPPGQIPKGTTQDGTSINPPQPTGDSYQVWDIDDVDFDGDGVTEDGVAMLDAANTLYVWWSDVSWWSDDELDGFLWLADQSAGFVLLLDDSVGLACADAGDGSSDSGGCIGCDAMGDCEVVAFTETWTGGGN